MAYEAEEECVIEAALLALGTGAVDSSGGKAKSLGLFVYILGDRQRFSEVGSE